MRSLLAIPLILMVSFTGIRIDYSAHLCGGIQVASVLSLSGKSASCGMEDFRSEAPAEPVLKNHCCDNVGFSFAFSNKYVPPSPIVTDGNHNSLCNGILCLPGMALTSNYIPVATNIRPPGGCHPNSVAIESLCILRI